MIGTPDVVAWFHAQNDYTRSILDALPGRDALYRRLSGIERRHARARHADRRRHSRVPEAGAGRIQVPACICATASTAPNVSSSIPRNTTGDGQAAAIEYFAVSPNGKRLAFGVALGGTEDATLHVIDVATRTQIGAPIPRARGANPAWRFDSEILFYTQQRDRTEGEPVADQIRGSRAYMRTFTPRRKRDRRRDLRRRSQSCHRHRR